MGNPIPTFPIRPPGSKAVACQNCSLNAFCLPKGLNRDELEQLEDSIQKNVKLGKKDYLFRRADPQNHIYAVKSGAIKTSLSTPEGEEQILGFFLPGDLLGFDAFANDAHTCDARALDDTLLCKLNVDDFNTLMGQLPNLRGQMMRKFGCEIEREQTLSLILGQMNTQARLATFLVSMSRRNQVRGFAPREFALPMPRHDLANYLGMAVETLSRLFSRFQEEGIISVALRQISINDMKRLNALAHHTCH
ncbi:MAG TPA: fumarate/nitrate reduction transcriptional regulator Fnr [Thiolinea sp.]|nr:fumarate/nitrate reduction transcriptional regulator Fnr [Thiolinea sp.]